MSKSLNCAQPEAGEPCCGCDSCEAVDAGTQDPGLRGLILQLAEARFSTGASEQALRWMRRLPELGLSTPEIDRRLTEIERRGHLDEETSQAILPQHDRYRFLARIAQGGNGVIYKARDNMLDRTIVIKMIAIRRGCRTGEVVAS